MLDYGTESATGEVDAWAFLPEELSSLAHVGNCQDPYPSALWLECDW